MQRYLEPFLSHLAPHIKATDIMMLIDEDWTRCEDRSIKRFLLVLSGSHYECHTADEWGDWKVRP